MIANVVNNIGPLKSILPRKALGDITNSVAPAQSNQNVRKKVFSEQTKVLETVNESNKPLEMPNRSYMMRESSDIDHRREGEADPDDVCQYVNEIYEYLKEEEQRFKLSSNFMTKQKFISASMRAILVDWMIAAHNTEHETGPLQRETLFLAINILDRYASRHPIRMSRYQLVGVVALFLACKYEEIYHPVMARWLELTAHAYTNQEFLQMQLDVVKGIHYDLSAPTAYTFLLRYVVAGSLHSAEMRLIARYLVERSLQEYEMLTFLPSVIAATAVMITRINCGFYPWSPTLLNYTGYDEWDLLDCAATMERLYSDPDCKQTAVARKFKKVAKVPLQYKK